MIRNNTWKLATILGVAGVIALSAGTAEARGGQRAATVERGAMAGGPYAYQPYAYQPSDSFAYQPSRPDVFQPSLRDSYGYIDGGVGYSGSGTFSDGRSVPGTNYNPNQ